MYRPEIRTSNVLKASQQLQLRYSAGSWDYCFTKLRPVVYGSKANVRDTLFV
jgi:hypothetical protein